MQLRQFMIDNTGYCPASWVHHLTGVSKAAISKAQGEGRVRVARFTFPDGRVVAIVSLQDALRLDVYRKAPGWADDIGDDAPPSRRRPSRKPPGRP